MTPAKYLKLFFEEKSLPYESWDLVSPTGVPHHIDSDVVKEAIFVAPEGEQSAIASMIRKIDCLNGDVNDYLKHLAQALVNMYE